MVNANYEKIVEKIAKFSNLEKEEVLRKIEAKRAKLSDLITYEGAAQIVAVELGVNFENERLKIDELLPGMRKVKVIGKILNISSIRRYRNKRGEESKVVNLIIADEVSNIKVVLWDINHIALIEDNSISEGSIIEINNGSMREGELHLGSFSEIKGINEVLENVITEKQIKEKNILEFSISDNIQNRAFIVQSFEPRFFYQCPECNKKVSTDGENYVCMEHGKILPNKKAVMNIILDDGTSTIRAVLFGDLVNSIGITDLDNPERLIIQREELLGKEMIFQGQVRHNKFFDGPEFIIDEVNEINLDKLIENLEKRI